MIINVEILNVNRGISLVNKPQIFNIVFERVSEDNTRGGAYAPDSTLALRTEILNLGGILSLGGILVFKGGEIICVQISKVLKNVLKNWLKNLRFLIR